jgi:endogenous inhibitor of DNA gyrase (YacG/DUF329 family)
MTKSCETCRRDIPNKSKQWRIQKYCSTRCRKIAFNKRKSQSTRIEKRKANLIQNDEVIYLIGECRRAGTVQILTDHTLKTFTKTMKFIKNRGKGDVERCHIAPVKGTNTTGLLHYKNLFYGGVHQNRKFGKKYHSGGLSIKNDSLIKKWKVNETMTNNDILKKVELILGDIIPRYIEKNSVLKSRKIRVVERILEIRPEKNKDLLLSQSGKYLDDLYSKLSNGNTYSRNYGIESKYMTYINEMTRFISYGGERKPLLKKLRRLMIVGYMALERAKESHTYNKYFYCDYEYLIKPKYVNATLKNPKEWSEFKDLIYGAAFNTLQGGHLDIKKLKKKFMSYLTFVK